MTNVTVTTAVPLNDKQVALIKSVLSKKINTNVTLEQIVNSEVVGGVRLTVGSSQLDATIRHKLDILKSQLLNI